MNHSMLKILAFLLFWCTVSLPLRAQVSQEGLALLQNSGRQPLSGVQVMALGAAPVSSDGNGRFILEFHSSRPGDKLRLNDAYKAGYSIINEEVLRNWRLSGEYPMEVVLCPTDVLLKRQEEYYGVGSDHYQSRYNAAIVALDSLRKAGILAREEYEARLDAAGLEYADAMERLEEYSYMIACINTDDLSAFEREVYAMIGAGDVLGAVRLLDKAEVLERFRRLGTMGEEADADIEAMIPSMKYYADICMFDGGTDNMLKARNILEEIALSDTTNYVYAMEYARELMDSFLDYEAAVYWLGVSMRHVTDSLSKLELVNMQGQALLQLSDYDRAFKVLYGNLSLIESLNMDSDEEGYEYVLKAYVEYFRTLSNVDYGLSNFSEALEVLDGEVLEISQMLYGYNPEKYAFIHGGTVSDISTIMVESRYMAEEGLKCAFVARQLFKDVPKNMEMRAVKEIVMSYMCSMAACSNLGRYEEALHYADSVVMLIDKYEARNPIIFVMYKAAIMDAYGTILCNQGDTEKGIHWLKSALETASVLPENSMLAVNASIYFHLAVSSEYIQDKQEVVFYARKACELYDRISYFSYHPFDVGAYMQYVDVLIQTGEHRLAADKLIEILTKIRILAEEDGPKLPLAGMRRFIELAAQLEHSGTEDFWKEIFMGMLKEYPPSEEKRKVRKLVEDL